MTDISSIAALPGATDATAGALAKSSTLGMGDFLKLMTTQLQTQDPFNPMDNTQMAAQLAQFSSVAGISEMNTSLKTLSGNLSGSRLGDAANLVGRNALVAGSTVTPLRDGSYAAQATLPSAISGGTVSLIDASGAVVHTMTLGAQGAGDVPIAWDGKDGSGTYAAGGPLRLVVSAKDASGAAVASTLATWAVIGGVQSPASGATKLVTPLGLIDPAAALQLG